MPDFCPVCRAGSPSGVLELASLPASIGIQWSSSQEARACRRGDVALVYCHHCGFIWNRSFDSSRLEYSKRYDNALDFSTVFQRYARTLAERLVDTYGIRGKRVVEIGCGKGAFLGLVCEYGANYGLGFDPSFEAERGRDIESGRITFRSEFYNEDSVEGQVDLICCRHVFEHIEKPTEFLTMLGRSIASNESTIVYFEVPNVRFILEKLSVWDIIYEHCNYFSRESLAEVFMRCGFEILRMEESYDGQFLSVDARRFGVSENGPRPEPDLTELDSLVQGFCESVRKRLATWRERMDEFSRQGRRCAIWGGGSKAVSFLSMVGTGNEVSYVVDINPHKQGMYMGGTGQKIVSPEFLKEFRPDVIILMNPIYRDEVSGRLKELGLSSVIVDV